MIRVVHVEKEPHTLYIGRAWKGYRRSKWANPYHATRLGRFVVLSQFEVYARRELWNDLHELDGQVLGCWCKPKACHGDILKKLREEQLDAIRSKTLSA